MIRSVTGSWVGYKTRDWFAVDLETAKPLFYQGLSAPVPIPGVRRLPGNDREVVVHRTHLPLLESSEASKLLTNSNPGDWQLRNEWCKARSFELRVTQQTAIDFIAPRRGTLLGDEMRLGKTLTALMSHDFARGQLIIVAPLSTRPVWLGWIRKLWPDVEVGVLTGKKKIEPERLKKPIVFCHYDILKHWQSTQPIGTLVLDEAHLLVNKGTDRSKAAVLLASRAEKIIAATGTPIWGMPPDLWNVVGILQPAAWGSYWDFGMRYGDPEHTGYGVKFRGATNVAELNARLSEIKIRRLWRDVHKDLPPISRNIVVADLDTPTLRKLDILAMTLRKERSNFAANLAIYRSHLCKFKLPVVLREAVQRLTRNEPVVIWTWHQAFAREISEGLGGSFLIHGDVLPSTRETIMDQWKSSKEPKALVATMAVAQVGIDLSHSHLPIFAELDYVPAVMAQTEMRTFSPSVPMNATYAIANHWVEQRIMRSLVSKMNASDPLGFGAAIDAIDALRDAFDGPKVEPDMEKFLDDILSSGLSY